MTPNTSLQDSMIEAARLLTPSKFMIWIEDHSNRFPDRKMDIEILNRDEVFNMNREGVLLKVYDMVFVFDNGVFQNMQ